MTLFFRSLSTVNAESTVEDLAHIFYDEKKMQEDKEVWNDWLDSYSSRVRQLGVDSTERARQMNRVNPLYVPRNYLLQEAIEKAENGDYGRVWELLDLFKKPYEKQPGKEQFAARRPDWAKDKPGCSQLSCSS